MSKRDDVDELAARLLADYRDASAPPDGAAGRVWASLDAAGIAGAAAGGAQAASLTLGGKLGLWGLALVVVGGGVWLAREPAPVQPRASMETAAAPSTAPREDAAAPSMAAAPPEAAAAPDPHERSAAAAEAAREPAPAAAPPTPAKVAPSTPVEPSTRPARAAGPSSLARELSLLSRAHSAQTQGRLEDALALLRQHRRQHPSGVMSEEREASRVQVLCELGHGVQAARVARGFERRFPGSPLAPRVRAACEAASP